MSTDQQLGATLTEAMRLADQMRAKGESADDIEAYLEAILRATWPQGRGWSYYCDECSDTGWLRATCTSSTLCGRPFQLPHRRLDDYTGRGRCSRGHTFVTPCWCAAGKHRRAALYQERTATEDTTTAAKVSKPTRIGR